MDGGINAENAGFGKKEDVCKKTGMPVLSG
jgi:hypothetical protein